MIKCHLIFHIVILLRYIGVVNFIFRKSLILLKNKCTKKRGIVQILLNYESSNNVPGLVILRKNDYIDRMPFRAFPLLDSNYAR